MNKTFLDQVVEYSPLVYSRDKNGIVTLVAPLSVKCIVYIEGRRHLVSFLFKEGFMCDGLSVPKCFRWFLKNWDPSNDLYNIAGIVHDALYGNKGWLVFSRDEADAIFRGLLRESGKDRKHASVADWAVGMFAASHWGDDTLSSAHLADMTIK